MRCRFGIVQPRPGDPPLIEKIAGAVEVAGSAFGLGPGRGEVGGNGVSAERGEHLALLHAVAIVDGDCGDLSGTGEAEGNLAAQADGAHGPSKPVAVAGPNFGNLNERRLRRRSFRRRFVGAAR